MGLVSRGMLWCYCFTILYNHSNVTIKMEEKQSKHRGRAHGQTKSPDLSL